MFKNSTGQTEDQIYPAQVYFRSENSNRDPIIRYITAGSNFAAALDESSRLFMWGDNSEGQLGHYEPDKRILETNRPKLTQLEKEDSEIFNVALGLYHTCVLTRHSKILVWGQNNNGQLGLGHKYSQDAPKQISVPEDVFVTSIACGYNNTALLTESGEILMAGNNSYYKTWTENLRLKWKAVEAGVNYLELHKFSNLYFDKENEFLIDIKLENSYSIGKTNYGNFYVWGMDPSRAENIKTTYTQDSDERMLFGPYQISSSNSSSKTENEENFLIESISCGTDISGLITKGGEVLVWGSNQFGTHGEEDDKLDPYIGEKLQDNTVKLVNNNINLSALPHFIPIFNIFEQRQISGIEMGSNHVLAIENSGMAYSWGDNRCGQLGLDLKTEIIYSPKIIRSINSKNIKSCYAKKNSSFVLLSSGSLYAFGDNSTGLLGINSETKKKRNKARKPVLVPINQNVVSLAVGQRHALAITVNTRKSGKLEMLINSENRTYEEEATITESNLFSWGSGMSGELGVGRLCVSEEPILCEGAKNLDLNFVSAGDEISAAISKNGKLYLWGNKDKLPKNVDLIDIIKHATDLKEPDKNLEFYLEPKVAQYQQISSGICEIPAQFFAGRVLLGRNFHLLIEGNRSGPPDPRKAKWSLAEGISLRDRNQAQDRYVYCWGSFNPQPTAADLNLRKLVTDGIHINSQKLALGDYHALLVYDSKIYTWGLDNYSGRLGSLLTVIDEGRGGRRGKKQKKKQRDKNDKDIIELGEVVSEPKECSLINLMISDRPKIIRKIVEENLEHEREQDDDQVSRSSKGLSEKGSDASSVTGSVANSSKRSSTNTANVKKFVFNKGDTKYYRDPNYLTFLFNRNIELWTSLQELVKEVRCLYLDRKNYEIMIGRALLTPLLSYPFRIDYLKKVKEIKKIKKAKLDLESDVCKIIMVFKHHPCNIPIIFQSYNNLKEISVETFTDFVFAICGNLYTKKMDSL